MPRPRASSLTHVGMVRTGNEDCFYSNDQLGLWLVADGMGGHEAGEVASAIVSETIAGAVKEGIELPTAIQFSHQAVLDGGNHGEGARGMGSTVVAIKQINDAEWQLAWVGDSRAYLWTKIGAHEGELQQISRDHSYVQALLDAGAITEQEADHHPDKNVITQCLGSLEIPTVRVDTLTQGWKPGQKILLCSDGLSDEVSDLQIAQILNQYDDSEEAVKALVDTALQNGGHDNVTAVLIDASQASFSPKKVAKNVVKVAAVISASLIAAALAGALIYYFG